MVFSAKLYKRDEVGFPLIELSESGVRVEVFGTHRPQVEPSTSAHLIRRIGPSHRASAYWVVAPFAYRLSLYTSDRREVRTLVRGEWFEPTPDTARPRTMFDHKFPSMEVRALWEDDSGLLWTATIVPSELWNPATLPSPRNPPPIDRPWDTVVEVIDVNSNAVIASTRLRGMAVYSVGRGKLAFYRESPDHRIPTLEVWQLHLSGWSRSPRGRRP